MAAPFKFRHVNEVAGGFVLLAVLLLLAGLAAIGWSQGWFSRTYRYKIALPENAGLKEGADVTVYGNVAGGVRSIHAERDAQGQFTQLVADIVVKVPVRNTYVFRIRRTLGFGDTYVEIAQPSPPVPSEPLPEYALIQRSSIDPVEKPATEALQATIEEIRKEVVPTLQEARASIKAFGELAGDLRDPKGDLHQTIARVNGVAGHIGRGEGLAGKLLVDPEMARQGTDALAKVNATVDEFNATVKDLRKAANDLSQQSKLTLQQTQAVLENIQKTTAALPDTAKTLNRTAETLPGLVLQMQETLRQIERLVEGLQRSFLVRGSMAPDATAAPLRPENVGAGGK